jgi:hypothetical protein
VVRHPGGPPKRTAGADVGTYVAGVAAGFGAVELPDDPPEPLPPMFGQLTVLPPAGWFGRVDGIVVVPGVVVLGADEAPGSGLAAETTAAAPPTRSSAESAAVSTARLSPEPFVCGAAGSGGARGAGWTGVRGAGSAGWSCHSNVTSWVHSVLVVVAGGLAQSMGTSGPVGAGVDAVGGPGSRGTDLEIDRREAF